MEQCCAGEQHVLPPQNVHGSIKELPKHVFINSGSFGFASSETWLGKKCPDRRFLGETIPSLSREIDMLLHWPRGTSLLPPLVAVLYRARSIFRKTPKSSKSC